MPNTYTTLSSLFTAIANALRSLKGTSAPIVADNFPSEISEISSKAAQTYTPTTADQTIAAGQYLSGAQTVKGDANLVAENIKKDVTIFGVTGSHEGGGGGGGTISLQSITITTTPTKTSYYDGDSFDPTGMVVTANYNYSMSRVITGYTYSPQTLALGDTGVTVSFTEDGVTKTATQAVTVEAEPGPTPAGNFATDSWGTIRAVSLAGKTAETYGNQVGTTRQITLTNNAIVTLRLANATNDMYARSNGEGTTGLVIEFAETGDTSARMFENTSSSDGGWNASDMRVNIMPTYYDYLPLDLKSVIETVDIKAMNGGGSGKTLITSQDKLFLPAERELLKTIWYSATDEWNALQIWQYYSINDTQDSRNKTTWSDHTRNRRWWLRTATSNSGSGFTYIQSDGSVASIDSNQREYVSPAFCI